MKMGEIESSCQMHSFNSFINNHCTKHASGNSTVSSTNSSTNGNYFNNETDGKKYKLRLKFDGACALEVVRLNGGHFQNLTHLDISGNSAEKLDLRSLARLEWLCCSNNNLEVLSLSGSSLTYLDCSRNNLQSISIEPVPNNLTTLQISFNNLEDLPKWTFIVPELFIIYASHNRLRQLDCKYQNCLSNLPTRELHLHCNKIEFVSKDFIQRATRLKILNLSQNIIEHMPNFGKKCNIHELYMSRNRLQDTEEKDALDFLLECQQIRRLYLAFNKIEQISERCMTVWKNLEELILCGNRIRSLPSKLSSMSNLRVLRVHSNRLETAPNLSKMPSLKVVDLSHNNLKKINIENLISGGNLTYLDISCNERLTLNPEKLSNHHRRPMNLVEVSNPRKIISPGSRNNDFKEFPANPPWEIGFSELPDRNQTLSITQYRDVNLSDGKEALFGIFDGGDGNAAPKTISKSIAKIFAEERNIEETHKFSLKYTLLNAMKNIRQQGNTKPVQGILCLLSIQDDPLLPGKQSFMLNVAMIGGIRCLLVETGRKITRLTDIYDGEVENRMQMNQEDDKDSDSNSDTSSTKCHSNSTTNANNLSGNIPDPKILSLPLTTAAEYLIIANQSAWNHVSEQELIEELENHRHKKSVLIAKRITDMAQSHSCKQSLSLILVRFKWHVTSSRSSGLGSIEKSKLSTLGEFGPLSYGSGSSDYSDVSNPLVSVTTPDSAIDTDRSSGSGSVAGSKGSGKSSTTKDHLPNIEANDFSKGSRKSIALGEKNHKDNINDEIESLTNTSISQMSVEQFRCWEYMLEQNTKLLFKKELDSLSKGAFQRNQKLRKSVHFPYQDGGNNSNGTKGYKSSQNAPSQSHTPGKHTSKSTTPGFYTLSKAKSLSHLFAADPAKIPYDPSHGHNHPHGYNPQQQQIQHHGHNNNINGFGNGFGKQVKSHFPIFNNSNGGFLGNVRSSTRRTILGGPNAAYFGSAQRLVPPPAMPCQQFYDPAEIQEIKNMDSMEHDSRLKKYWDNKITEL